VDEPLRSKLQLRTGVRPLVLGAPNGYLERLGGDVDERTRQPGGHAFVQAFVRDARELEARWPDALTAGERDAVLWLCYPKQASKIETDLTRDRGWAVVDAGGYRPVRQVSVDETWSALRFRHRDEAQR